MNDTPTIFTRRGLILFMLPLLALGCSKDLPRLSVSQLEAVNHNHRGVKAETRGDHDLALEEFRESLRVNSSIDNTEGRIVALVNISRVSRYKGDTESALEAVDQALELTSPKSALFSELAFEKGSVELQLQNLAAARNWAAKSISAEKGNKLGSRLNLLARILYLEKQHEPARELAEEALAINKTGKLTEEEANSLRLLGSIHTTNNRTGEALAAYEQALAIDKSLGKSRKIAADLRGLAALHASSNNIEQATEYYRRAHTVSLNDGDVTAAAGDLLHMSDLYERLGEKDKSLQLLNERYLLLEKYEKP